MQKNQKGKIAIFHCGFIYSGGGERIVLEEARGLVKRGWGVRVYAPTVDTKKCYPEFVKGVGVKMFFPSVFNKLPLRNALRMLASSFLAPFLAINFRDIDVFVGANQPGVWIAFCMAMVLRKPYMIYLNQPNRIVYPRAVDREFGWYTTEKDYHFLYKLLQRLIIVLVKLDWLSSIRAKSLLVNGSYIGNIIANVYGREVVDTPAGANFYSFGKTDVFRGSVKIAGKKITKPYLLITNRHDPQKRFDYVISALSNISGKVPNLQLVVPGPFTDHTRKLIEHSRNLGIEKKVRFIGKVSEEDLHKLYRHCAVYCYPSPDEDFGLGPLEAGGWGVPTVAWNHAGPTVTVEDGVTGFLAEPYSVKDFGQKILTVLNNPNLRNKMGAAAWKRTKNLFSWERHVDILESEITKYI